MAQTIATQRGNVSAGNSSQTTLFTQSGGNSTRVILNQVAWYYSSRICPIYGNLLHVSSSGTVTVIGWYNFSNSVTTAYSAQMIPNPNGTSPTQTNYTGSVSASSNSASPLGFGTGWSGSSTPNNWTVGNNLGQSYMPQNYWIGPGDSIAFSQYNDSALSATVGYHFTTITES